MLNVVSLELNKTNTVKLVYNDQPWDSKKLSVVMRWSVFRGFSIQIGLTISMVGLSLAVVERWSLFTVGMDVSTVDTNKDCD
jgi:hypothetical protein